MNCREFTSIVRDYARLEWLSGPVREEAAEHVSGCPACRERLTLELAYESRRAALVQQRASVRAPQQVESQVMAAFRNRAKSRPAVQPLWRRRWMVVPAVAALILLAVLLRPRTEKTAVEIARMEPTVEPRTSVQPPSPEVGEPPRVEVAMDTVVSPRVTRPRVEAVRQSAAPMTRRAADPSERVTEFVPLRYGKPVEPGELLQVVRIQLDRRELLRLGIPIPPDGGLASVRADVILGEDGMAKAIRFVY